jgi:hypothetical protein
VVGVLLDADPGHLIRAVPDVPDCHPLGVGSSEMYVVHDVDLERSLRQTPHLVGPGLQLGG